MRSLLLIGALALTGCQKETSTLGTVDAWAFEWSGGTVFSDPYQVTSKQLHFDTGQLFGKEVILEGQIEYFGESQTHLLLSDKDGRFLVVTTDLPELYKSFGKDEKVRVRVLGHLERGKKGLPYLMAQALQRRG